MTHGIAGVGAGILLIIIVTSAGTTGVLVGVGTILIMVDGTPVGIILTITAAATTEAIVQYTVQQPVATLDNVQPPSTEEPADRTMAVQVLPAQEQHLA
jgi:hypothetical protein